MRKVEAQHDHPQNPTMQRRGGNATLESPQGEQIAQVEAMANSSSQAAAQRRMMDLIHNSPRMVTQRQVVDGLFGSAAQRSWSGARAEEAAQREEAPAKPNNTGLSDKLKNGIEPLPGISMDPVKMHYNSSQPAQLSALTPTNQPPIQCYLTRAESAAGDVLHRERADIFEESTLTKYGSVARRWYPSWGDKVTAVKNAIEADRDLDYKRMSSDTLTSYSDARSLVGDNREHMYVHVGNGIYRGDRTNEKLPHPALFGYDPDVDGAGTLRATFHNNTLRVKVTNSSGHFRPPEVSEETRAKVEEKVRNGRPARTRVFVDINNQ